MKGSDMHVTDAFRGDAPRGAARWIAAILALGTVCAITGCLPAPVPQIKPAADRSDVSYKPLSVPRPINLTLPRKIRIHPFSDVRRAASGQTTRGIDVRIEAIDSFGDANKAFGTFRFELYAFSSNNPNPRGALITTWSVEVMAGKDNLLHWDTISRTYLFKLQWDQPIATDQPFVLGVVFASPFTERLFAQRVFGV